MAYVSRALRQLVTERAGGLCEYCHTAQAIVIEMEIDHSVPEVVGGITEAGNLCLACISCNTCKRDYQTGIDSQTDAEVPLFHPRQQPWHEHFQWDEEGTHIIGTTAIGRAQAGEARRHLRGNRPHASLRNDLCGDFKAF